MKRELSTFLFLFISIGQLVACSGPGAAEAIQNSIEVGYYCAIGSIALTLLTGWIGRSVRTLSAKIALIISIILTVMHPGVWISAMSGDCGIVRLYASIIVTGLIGVILVWITFKRSGQAAANKERTPLI